MPKQAFASTIINKMKGTISQDGSSYNAGSPALANLAIAQGITEYLISNVKISVNFSGMIPGVPPVPDICPDMVMITGTCPPPSGTNFNSWVKSIETSIMSGFFIGPGSAGVMPLGVLPAFTIPGLIIPQSSLKSAHEGNTDSPQQPVWEVICDGIMKWLQMATVPTYPAMHIAPAGISSVLKTTVI